MTVKKKSRYHVFEVKPIPVSSEDHPESPNVALPKHGLKFFILEFTMGLIAPKGRGVFN